MYSFPASIQLGMGCQLSTGFVTVTRSHIGNGVYYSSVQLLAAAKIPFIFSFNTEMMQINYTPA